MDLRKTEMIYDSSYLSMDNPDSRYHYLYQRMVNRWTSLIIGLIILAQFQIFSTWNLFGYFMLGVLGGACVIIIMLFIWHNLIKQMIESFLDWLSGY